MKKINVLVALCLLVLFNSFAQKAPSVTTNTKSVGKNLHTGETILANEYTFSDRVHEFKLDTTNNDLLIQLRALKKERWLANKGEVIRFDIDNKKVQWSSKIAYLVEKIDQYGEITLRTTNVTSFCLDNFTGQPVWEVKNALLFANPVNKIGIGYSNQPLKGKENLLEGINLSNGQPIWQREISRDYSWNDIFYLNDSTLLIAASGLHTLNIFDGKGWDYHTVTGKKDYTASAVGTGLGIAAGLLTGTYGVATGHNLVREVVSNVVVDGTNIYFASKEHLVKINLNGEILWQTALPSDNTSKSWLYKIDDKLLLVNSGYAYMGYRQLDFGTPFIASYDIANGDQDYLVNVTDEKKKLISDVEQKEDTLLLVFSDHVSQYSINSGQLIKDRQFKVEAYGALNRFIEDQLFVQRAALFTSLSQIDSSKLYLSTINGKILILDSDLNLEGEIDTEALFVHYLTRNELKFIANNQQTYVIDAQGAKIGEFPGSSKSTFFNGKLYDAQERSLLEIDLAQFLAIGAFH